MSTETLQMIARFTWERSLPIWEIQLLDKSGKVVHREDKVNMHDAELLAITWAINRGFNVLNEWNGKLISAESAVDSLQEPT